MLENGMEKLIELLNEYEGDTDNPTWTLNGANEPLYGGWTAYASAYLIPSKKYGFIKRLVDYDKIDFEKNKLQVLKDIDVRGEVFCDFTLFDKTDGVIMLLAVSENPISDLLDILK